MALYLQGVEQIFSHIECSQEKQFLLRVSYMEIYNECIYDLLADEKESRKALKIRGKINFYGDYVGF